MKIVVEEGDEGMLGLPVGTYEIRAHDARMSMWDSCADADYSVKFRLLHRPEEPRYTATQVLEERNELDRLDWFKKFQRQESAYQEALASAQAGVTGRKPYESMADYLRRCTKEEQVETDPTHIDRMIVDDPKSCDRAAPPTCDRQWFTNKMPDCRKIFGKYTADNDREAHVPLPKRAPCRECSGTGFYESPVSGKRSPCSAGCKTSC